MPSHAESRHALRSQHSRFTGGWLPIDQRKQFERAYRRRGLSLTEALREAIASWIAENDDTGQRELPV